MPAGRARKLLFQALVHAIALLFQIQVAIVLKPQEKSSELMSIQPIGQILHRGEIEQGFTQVFQLCQGELLDLL